MTEAPASDPFAHWIRIAAKLARECRHDYARLRDQVMQLLVIPCLIFTVTKIEPPRQRPLAEVKQTIKETLVAEAQQAALDAFVQEFRARWRAKTECAKGYRTTD